MFWQDNMQKKRCFGTCILPAKKVPPPPPTKADYCVSARHALLHLRCGRISVFFFFSSFSVVMFLFLSVFIFFLSLSVVLFLFLSFASVFLGLCRHWWFSCNFCNGTTIWGCFPRAATTWLPTSLMLIKWERPVRSSRSILFYFRRWSLVLPLFELNGSDFETMGAMVVQLERK